VSERTCYIMVKDVPGQGAEEAALEWGVTYDLEEGEELPKDVEELTEAQYTVFMMVQTLKGTFEDSEVNEIRGEKGTGLIVPT
jgi:hypothetical protein